MSHSRGGGGEKERSPSRTVKFQTVATASLTSLVLITSSEWGDFLSLTAWIKLEPAALPGLNLLCVLFKGSGLEHLVDQGPWGQVCLPELADVRQMIWPVAGLP